MAGIYGEKWIYDPSNLIFADPLNVIRQENGQCGDYANLLTNLYRSVGVPANPIVIYNGIDLSGIIYLLFWRFTELYGYPYVSMLTKKLRSCDGVETEWIFNYHAVPHCSTFFIDASLGLFKPESNSESWVRYYLHPRSLWPPFSHGEPPQIPPVYYDWPDFIPAPPGNVFP